jgi:hypothetical protein
MGCLLRMKTSFTCFRSLFLRFWVLAKPLPYCFRKFYYHECFLMALEPFDENIDQNPDGLSLLNLKHVCLIFISLKFCPLYLGILKFVLWFLVGNQRGNCRLFWLVASRWKYQQSESNTKECFWLSEVSQLSTVLVEFIQLKRNWRTLHIDYQSDFQSAEYKEHIY